MKSNVLEQAQAVLNVTPLNWLNLTSVYPTQLLQKKPGPDAWSAVECLQHLVDTEKWVFPVRIQLILNGKDFPAFDPDSQGSEPKVDITPKLLAEEFSDLRQDALKVFALVSTEDLILKSRHQELGVVTLSELLHEWAGHDLMHTVQAEQALMQPFIQNCGPWRGYFRSHDVQFA